MNIDERVQTLEKQNEKIEKQNETFAGQIKNLKKMLGGVATLALAALIGGTALGVHAANGSFDTITARTLYLKKTGEKARVMLDSSRGFGHLLLRDAMGRTRLELSGRAGNIEVYKGNIDLYHDGKERVSLGSNGVIRGLAINAPHKHTASSSNARSGVNKHSHPVTVK
jgi:hypothetical protein